MKFTFPLPSAIDRCTTAICLNGGTCRNEPIDTGYWCECPRETSGLYCEVVGKYLGQYLQMVLLTIYSEVKVHYVCDYIVT